MGVHVAPHPHHVVGGLDLGPNRSVVASCYSFNVHFPYDEWCETSIHLLTFHFHSFSPEMTVKVPGPFLNKVVSFLILEFYQLFFFFLYVSGNSPVSDVYFASVFSYSVAGLLILLHCISGIGTSSCWWNLLFLSRIMPLMLYLKSSSFPRSSKIFPMVSCRSCIVLHFIQYCLFPRHFLTSNIISLHEGVHEYE